MDEAVGGVHVESRSTSMGLVLGLRVVGNVLVFMLERVFLSDIVVKWGFGCDRAGFGVRTWRRGFASRLGGGSELLGRTSHGNVLKR